MVETNPSIALCRILLKTGTGRQMKPCESIIAAGEGFPSLPSQTLSNLLAFPPFIQFKTSFCDTTVHSNLKEATCRLAV